MMSLRTTGGKSDDDAHRPRRIGLRPCDARHDRQRGGARGQMQEFRVGKFHLALPSRSPFDHLVGAAVMAFMCARRPAGAP